MQENICRTVISGEEQNLNEQMANLHFHTFSIFYVHFGQIQYFFNTFNTAWEPCQYLNTLKKFVNAKYEASELCN